MCGENELVDVFFNLVYFGMNTATTAQTNGSMNDWVNLTREERLDVTTKAKVNGEGDS